MCIRALSKKARSKQLEVPDFDIVMHGLFMPTDMVESIRNYLEKPKHTAWNETQCSYFPGNKGISEKDNEECFMGPFPILHEDSDEAGSTLRMPEYGSLASALEGSIDVASSVNSTSSRSLHFTDESYWSSKSSIQEQCPESNLFSELDVPLLTSNKDESKYKDIATTDTIQNDWNKQHAFYHSPDESCKITKKQINAMMLCDFCLVAYVKEVMYSEMNSYKSSCFCNERAIILSTASVDTNMIKSDTDKSVAAVLSPKLCSMNANCHEGAKLQNMAIVNSPGEGPQLSNYCINNTYANKRAVGDDLSLLHLANVKVDCTNKPRINGLHNQRETHERCMETTCKNDYSLDGTDVKYADESDADNRLMVNPSLVSMDKYTSKAKTFGGELSNVSRRNRFVINMEEAQTCSFSRANRGSLRVGYMPIPQEAIASIHGLACDSTIEEFASNAANLGVQESLIVEMVDARNSKTDLKSALRADSDKLENREYQQEAVSEESVEARRVESSVASKKNPWPLLLAGSISIFGTVIWLTCTKNKHKRNFKCFEAQNGILLSKISQTD